MRSALLTLSLLVFGLLSGALAGPLAAQQSVTFERDSLAIETAAGARHDFEVELAVAPAQMARGLMFRRQMAADAGMLFILPHERVLNMWMRNTYLPLDMIFLGKDGRIVKIAERTVPLSEATITSGAPVAGVLEVNAGTAKRLGLAVGDRVLHPAFNQAKTN